MLKKFINYAIVKQCETDIRELKKEVDDTLIEFYREQSKLVEGAPNTYERFLCDYKLSAAFEVKKIAYAKIFETESENLIWSTLKKICDKNYPELNDDIFFVIAKRVFEDTKSREPFTLYDDFKIRAENLTQHVLSLKNG